MSDLYGVSRRRLVGEAWFWIAIVLASFLVIAVATFGIRWVTAGPRGQLAAREQILSGSNRIVAYNHFFDLCAAVQATEGALSSSLDELAASTDPQDKQRIQTNITGLSAQRIRSITQYNADARKNYTVGQFRSLQLPFELSTAPYEKGKLTSCFA